MSRRERERVFAAAVVAIAVALIATPMLGESDDEQKRSPSPATAHIASNRVDGSASVVTDAVDAADSRSGPDELGASRAREAAERIARRFITAFDRYQRGGLDDTTARRLRALATPELATYLLAQPPRATQPSPDRMRIERLDVAGPRDGRMKAAALLAYGNQRRSLFEIALDRSGGRWRVAELYPSGD
jgi:hypothetical protein